jgi:hypothetical protein
MTVYFTRVPKGVCLTVHFTQIRYKRSSIIWLTILHVFTIFNYVRSG